jgi:hypothetical protein
MKLAVQMPRFDRAIDLPFRRKRRRYQTLRRWWPVGASAVAGAVAMFLIDPRQGRRRRALARDRSGGVARHSARRLGRSVKRFGATLTGDVKGLRHAFSRPVPVANDQMLTDRVKSQVFRGRDLDHSRINLNVEDGVVVLHGVLSEQDQIGNLTKAARKVPGVRDVTSYLHSPNSPAPSEGPRHHVHGPHHQSHD